MLTPVAHTIQLPEETQPETAPEKPKGKSASQATASDFSLIVCQFLGTVALNAQQTHQEITTDAGVPAVVAQPAPQPVLQPAPQPAADASPTLPESAALLLGIKSPEAPAAKGAETANLPIAAPGSEDKAGLPVSSGNNDALMPAANANDKTTANNAVEANRKTSDKTGEPQPPSQKKPDLHELPAKQDLSGVVVDKSKTGTPADADRSNTPSTDGAFHTIMHQESSGAQNVQAQISGAAIPHRPHEESGPAPLHAAAADVLDTAPAIVKDGNRLAVKFEQEGLGKLDIDLRLNKGMINAHIQATDDSTKTLIENNMQQLVDSLLKAGLSVGGFSVSLKGGGQQHGTFEEQYGAGTERAIGVTGEAGGITQCASAHGLVSIFI